MSNPHDDARAIFSAALAQVDPVRMMARAVSLEGDLLRIRTRADSLDLDLRAFDRILVFGAGKASARMALGLEAILGSRISGGTVVVKTGHVEALSRIRLLEASHPVPDASSQAAAKALLDLARGADARTLCLGLTSGGGLLPALRPAARPEPGGQAGHHAGPPGQRGLDPGSQRGPQAPLRHQGRSPGPGLRPGHRGEPHPLRRDRRRRGHHCLRPHGAGPLQARRGAGRPRAVRRHGTDPRSRPAHPGAGRSRSRRRRPVLRPRPQPGARQQPRGPPRRPRQGPGARVRHPGPHLAARGRGPGGGALPHGHRRGRAGPRPAPVAAGLRPLRRGDHRHPPGGTAG